MPTKRQLQKQLNELSEVVDGLKKQIEGNYVTDFERKYVDYGEELKLAANEEFVKYEPRHHYMHYQRAMVRTYDLSLKGKVEAIVEHLKLNLTYEAPRTETKTTGGTTKITTKKSTVVKKGKK